MSKGASNFLSIIGIAVAIAAPYLAPILGPAGMAWLAAGQIAAAAPSERSSRRQRAALRAEHDAHG